MSNRSDESRHPCLVPIFGEILFTVKQDVSCGFFTEAFHHTKEVPSYSERVRCVYHERVTLLLHLSRCSQGLFLTDVMYHADRFSSVESPRIPDAFPLGRGA